MKKKIKAEQFSTEIKNQLLAFQSDVIDIHKEETDNVAKEGLKVLKSHARVRTGAYKKSLSNRKVSESALAKTRVLYAKAPHYREAHLIENGHAKRGGGRTRAFPHFKYADDYILKKLPEKIINRIKKLK